ncbi:hypothetical protein GCM10027292_22000 [Hydrogenophaga aquatica]
MQPPNFKGGEEVLSDFRVSAFLTNGFNIHTNAGMGGDGDECQVRRMGQVESEPAAQHRVQLGFSRWVADVAHLVRRDTKVAPQNVTQGPMGGHETLLIAPEPET